MEGSITHVDDVDDLGVHGEHLRPLLTHAMGSPIEVVDHRGEVGAGPPPHHHPWHEIFVVVAGELDVSIGDQEVRRLGPGSLAHVPAGTTHSFRYVDPHTHVIGITSEGRASDLFRAASRATPEQLPGVGPLFGLQRDPTPHPHTR
ncbi:MAG: cupin domain-containing protein [Ilumatobacteraceae bacterium]